MIESKTIAIIVANEFEDIELEYPLLRLSEEGADIYIVPIEEGTHPRPSLEDKPVTGRYGTPIPPAVMEEGYRFEVIELDELDLEEIDCILLPGGFSPDSLRINSEVVDLVREAHRKEKVLAAICHGPQVLIEADLVNGRKVTAFEAIKRDLINAGADFTDEPAVSDGNIVTGRVPDDLPEFCQEITKVLEK